MADLIGGYGYAGRLGSRHRMIVKYGDRFAPLLWFSVGRDGSLYVGPYVPKPKEAKLGSFASDAAGTATVQYADGRNVDISLRPDATKLSIHSSGKMHALGEHAFRQSLRGITDQQELCSLLFQHIDSFPSLKAVDVRPKDAVTQFVVDPLRPLQCRVTVSPTSKLSVLEVGGARQQWRSIVNYKAIAGMGDLSFQFLLFDAGEAAWPPASYVITKATGGGWARSAPNNCSD